MKNITVTLSYYDIVHMLQADARRLADAEKLSYSDLVERTERMKKYPGMLREAWGNGLGAD